MSLRLRFFSFEVRLFRLEFRLFGLWSCLCGLRLRLFSLWLRDYVYSASHYVSLHLLTSLSPEIQSLWFFNRFLVPATTSLDLAVALSFFACLFVCRSLCLVVFRSLSASLYLTLLLCCWVFLARTRSLSLVCSRACVLFCALSIFVFFSATTLSLFWVISCYI